MPPTPSASDSSSSPLRLHNHNATDAGLEPVTKEALRVYVSGTTTVDDADVGAARSLIVFDVLVRHLRARGVEVTLRRAQDGDADDGAPYDVYCDDASAGDAPAAAPPAPLWLRTGGVTFPGGAPARLRDVLARNDAEALRYAVLATHYRAPFVFEALAAADAPASFPPVDDAERRVDYLYATREALFRAADGARPHTAMGLAVHAAVIAEAPGRLAAALDNDLDTPRALAALGDLARAGNEIVMQIPRIKNDARALAGARGLAAKAVKAITNASAALGLLQAPHDDYAARTTARRLALRNLDAAVVQAKVDARVAARAAKDFDAADAIRAELSAMGVDVFDNAAASTWRIAV